MDEQKEIMCINILHELFSEKYSDDEFSVNGSKESAVCLEKKDALWDVYEKEKNSRNDLRHYDNVVEACMDMISRMAYGEEIVKMKNEFLNKIIEIKTA